ncbi:hypothetical protein N7486_006201 [Penicillium sp. IBT 16267x]|nr:hypothetical protein N7486_006201 [Penicillium sp. IBT 16267x]
MPCSEHCSKLRSRLWFYLKEDIREDLLLESELIFLSFATGIQDAASWKDYDCFASNQTGNALFLAIGAAKFEGSAYSVSHVGMSLGAFLAGGLVVGQIGNYFGVRKRLWLITSSALQTVMVYAAAAIQHSFTTYPNSPAALVAIFLLAFSSGAQVALGRSLKITDITTAMATSAFIDVAVDPGLLKRKNRQRNRRVIFLLTLTAGCFVGAFSQKAVDSTLALFLCAICKTIVTFAFLLNKPIEH